MRSAAGPFLGLVGCCLGSLRLPVIRLLWAGWLSKSSQPASDRVLELLRLEGPVWAMAAGIVALVLPRVEIPGISGDPVGIAVRGYGMFLTLAAITSVGLAAWRADRAGLGSEMIFQLAPWTFLAGIVGARLFFVVQYWRDFVGADWQASLASMLLATQGGLVVYGGLIGGFLASWWIIRKHQLPFWKLGDVIVPCIFVGLLFGRLGCLMNGCCFGGVCEPGPLALKFPPGSPVYMEQMLSGEVLGMEGEPIEQRSANSHSAQRTVEVNRVASGSLAAKAGIQAGEYVTLALDANGRERLSPDTPAEDALLGLLVFSETPQTGAKPKLIRRYTPDQLPTQANPVFGTQILSSLLAAIMFVLLMVLEWVLNRNRTPIENHDPQTNEQDARRPLPAGVLMLLGFMGYATIRIVLEWIRVDEAGQFGTMLSISQWVSLLVIVLSGIALWVRMKSSSAPALVDA